MSIGNLVLTTNKVPLRGKQGILRPDADGYYELPIGGFNCENSIGEVYTMQNIEKLFSSNEEIQRKVQSGKMMGEWGHPTPKPGETDNAYMARAGIVDDKDTCVLFREIWLDKDIAKSEGMQAFKIPKEAVVTMAKLKPHGSKWEALQRALDDPNCNISFSVRNLSYDKTIRGVVYVIIVKIITWDAVIDPGLSVASKWLAPRLESNRKVITPDFIDSLERNMDKGLVRMEAKDSVSELITASRDFFSLKKVNRSGFHGW